MGTPEIRKILEEEVFSKSVGGAFEVSEVIQVESRFRIFIGQPKDDNLSLKSLKDLLDQRLTASGIASDVRLFYVNLPSETMDTFSDVMEEAVANQNDLQRATSLIDRLIFRRKPVILAMGVSDEFEPKLETEITSQPVSSISLTLLPLLLITKISELLTPVNNVSPNLFTIFNTFSKDLNEGNLASVVNKSSLEHNI